MYNNNNKDKYVICRQVINHHRYVLLLFFFCHVRSLTQGYIWWKLFETRWPGSKWVSDSDCQYWLVGKLFKIGIPKFRDVPARSAGCTLYVSKEIRETVMYLRCNWIIFFAVNCCIYQAWNYKIKKKNLSKTLFLLLVQKVLSWVYYI